VCVHVFVWMCVREREREREKEGERERGREEERERGREGERERGRESQAASKLVSISVKRDLVWRQKRPSKEVSRGFIRGGPVTHNLSSLPGLVS